MYLLDIATWWADKILYEQIFWALAMPSTLILFILLITTFIGGDGAFEGDVDAAVELDGGAGVQFFTFKNLIGFFTIFGWVGIGCIHSGLSETYTLLISFVSGAAMMTAMALTFYFLSRLVEDGSFRMKNTLGRMAEVYLPIPSSGNGLGKVQMSVQGSVKELDALTRDEEPLPRGTMVQVHDIVDGHILLVSKHITKTR